MAQLVARFVRNEEVGGSNPPGSTMPAPAIASSCRTSLVQRWRRPVIGAAAVWLVVRLIQYAVVGIIALVDPKVARTGFFELFKQWDAQEFSSIAVNGYFGPGTTDAALQAYFPGFPAAVRGLATVLFGPVPGSAQIDVALWLVPLIASLAAGIAFWRLVADRFGDRVALVATVLLLAGPYSVFLLAGYSEALFLAFAIPAWLCASRGRWLTAGILAGLASFTRINGVFLAAALVVLLAIALHRAGRRWFWRAVAMGAIGVSGAAAYLGYLWAKTGDPLAWTTAQYVGWGRITQPPWRTLRRTIFEATVPGSPTQVQYWFDLVFAALLVLAAVVLLLRRWWPELVYVVLTAIPLMTSLTYLSLARNTVLLFPLPILVASALLSRRWRWVAWVVLPASLIVMVFTTSELVQGHWAD